MSAGASSVIIEPLKRLTQTISVTSGKGGVGKTTILCNLACQLAKNGKNVLLLDGDLGMANVDIMFGVKTQFSIRDVISGEKSVEEILVQVDPRIWLIPGGSGFLELSNLDDYQKRTILDQISRLKMSFDYMLVDTAPGIDSNVLYFNTSAQDIVVVVTPDPASVTDAYALIKVLNKYYDEKRFLMIANQVRDEQEAMQVYQRLSDVSQKFLNVSLDYLGSVPNDLGVRRATKHQQIFVKSAPELSATLAMKKITDKVMHAQKLGQPKGGIQFFWEQFMGVA